MLKLSAAEYIVTAYAKSASGSGWSNRPVWVIIRDKFTGQFREDCLQPDEQCPEIWALYNVSQAAHEMMTGLVESVVAKGKPKRKAAR